MKRRRVEWGVRRRHDLSREAYNESVDEPTEAVSLAAPYERTDAGSALPANGLSIASRIDPITVTITAPTGKVNRVSITKTQDSIFYSIL